MGTYNDRDFEQLKEVVEENNRILKRLNRRANFSTIYSLFKWTIIIGLAIGAFTFLKPIFQQLWVTYQSILDGLAAVGQVKDTVSDLSITEFLGLINR